MSFIRQQTLKTAIACTGIGLHSGERISMTLHPADPGTGIVFRRADLGGTTVAAHHDNVSATMLCTTLSDGNGTGVATVEHLMSAFAGLGVDNVEVELDGPEVPIMDGSAAPFVFLVECAGLVEQAAPRKAIQVLKTVEVSDGDRSASLTPSDRSSVSMTITYDHPVIGNQTCYFEIGGDVFKREVCRARTYGFMRDVEMLRERGFALGGSLDNAVVLSDDKVINDEGLRYADEFVRHKALDCIGDLYLAGGPVICHMDAFASGHTVNHQLLTALFDDDDAWRYVTLDDAATWPAAKVAVSA